MTKLQIAIKSVAIIAAIAFLLILGLLAHYWFYPDDYNRRYLRTIAGITLPPSSKNIKIKVWEQEFYRDVKTVYVKFSGSHRDFNRIVNNLEMELFNPGLNRSPFFYRNWDNSMEAGASWWNPSPKNEPGEAAACSIGLMGYMILKIEEDLIYMKIVINEAEGPNVGPW